MPISSPTGTLLEKWLSVDLNALRALHEKHPEEATELIARIRAFVKQMRPDLFEPMETR